MPLRELDGKHFDVAVLGAGINGVSAARELASAGYSVLLIEKEDFAAGASGRSSRILHCGLRYFETPFPVRDFGLRPVQFARALHMAGAAMEARREITALVPDRVKPFTMCFPIYADSVVRPWHLDVGLGLLKLLGPKEPPLDYRKVTHGFEAPIPFINDLRNRDQLQAVATYREYIFDWPDRLCVDAALEAERNGARICLFCEAQLAGRHEDGSWLISLNGTRDPERASVTTRIVLNVTGTWIDEVNEKANVDRMEPGRRLIQGTKGAHIVVRLPEAYRGFGLATMHRGNMPFYCLPSHEDYFYFGPTETPFEGDAATARTTDDDIDFLLAEANFLLPGLGLTRRHVVFTWCGVRPLTFDQRQPLGRRSREIYDLAEDGLPGVFALTAGPVMTHRSAGREMLRIVIDRLKPTRAPGRAEAAPLVASSTTGIAMPELTAVQMRARFRQAVTAEHARDLKGILYTRTGLAWRRHLSRQEVTEAAKAVADLFGWTQVQMDREISEFIAYQRSRFPAAANVSAQEAETLLHS